MADISRQQLSELLSKAPQGTNPQAIVQGLVSRGYTIEGYNEKSSLFKNIGREIVKPFAQGAELIHQGSRALGSLGKAGVQLAKGDKKGANETFANEGKRLEEARKNPIRVLGGDVKRIESMKDAAGTTLNIASNFVGGAGAVKAGGQLFKSTIKSAVKTGAKVGAKSGALYGAGEALQNDEGVIAGATKGALTGGLFGGAIPVAAGVAGKAVKFAKNPAEKVLSVAEKKLETIARDLVKMSPKISQYENRVSKNTPAFLLKEGVLPNITNDGKYLNTENAVKMLKTKASAENKAFENVLADSGEYISLNDYKQRLLDNLTDGLKNKGSDLDKATKHIETEVSAYMKNYVREGIAQGDDVLIRADAFNKIKQGLWSKVNNFNPTNEEKLFSNLNYGMGHVAKDMIEEAIPDAQIISMNSRLGDFAQAIRVLEKAQGKVVPGGLIGKYSGKIAGTIAGATSGIPGAIIGNITGGSLADLAANPQIRTGLLSKIYTYLNKTPKGMSIVEEAANILQKRGETRAARKLLEAPSFIPTGPKTDTSRLFSQEEAKQLLDSFKIKVPPKLLKAPLGDKTNPIILKAKKK
jgi:hypothetical protein